MDATQQQTANTKSVEILSDVFGDALDRILESMRQRALSKREQGTNFELLMLQVFKKARVYSSYFVDVQLYHDWAVRHPELHPSLTDIGIDLVATLRETKGEGRFVAIQCKFYKKDSSVPKSDIDSFLAASSTSYFAERILVATNKGWSPNTRNTYIAQEKPIQLISLEMLKQLDIDWESFVQDAIVKLKPKRTLRKYQEEAIGNVFNGFKQYDRGKLIMACGTGKTFTSLRLAEKQVGEHGLVLFLVPSLSLLSQTLNDWVQNSSNMMTAIPVCSDESIGSGKGSKNDDLAQLFAMHDLAYPATTDARKLTQQVDNALRKSQGNPKLGLTVVFSTYQSLAVIHEAQSKYHLPEFDLIICDEAHRTAGAYFVGANAKSVAAQIEEAAAQKQDEANILSPESKNVAISRSAKELDFDKESFFTLIHHQSYVQGKKRLYMTATPKIYGEAPKKQEEKGDVVLYSMDNEDLFGPVFYALNFDMAVQLGCLVDYQVIVLAGDIGDFVSEEKAAEFSAIQQTRVINAWKALNKYGTQESFGSDTAPMKRAVAFAQRIDAPQSNSRSKRDVVASKLFTKNFPEIVEQYRQHVNAQGEKDLAQHQQPSKEYADFVPNAVDCECKHIDGSMDSVTKSDILSWLRQEPEEKQCKLLFNVRCLSEGVDVPSLDAVVFLSPRKSMVEVVQIVGRVMRKAPNKKRGYVIIPIVTTNLNNPEFVLENSDEFKMVWEVLNALKSINPNHVLIDSYLHKLDDRIAIICTSNNTVGIGSGGTGGGEGGDPSTPPQPEFSFEETAVLEEKIKAIVLKKLGNRRDWEDWAQDVGKICTNQVEHIKELVGEKASAENKQAFARFKQELSAATRVSLSDDDVIDMLSQHIVIKPVLDELFRGYAFTKKNAIAHAMSRMVEYLDQEGLSKANEELKGFYTSVGFRMKNVTTLEERQKVIVELFDRFFKVAFPKQQEKLGIVYTPIEVVDFILHSVNDLLQQEFGCNFSSHNVHVLDPFTGTGTFISRLLQNEFITAFDLDYKYKHELHAFEILPLAYYIASINIEATFAELYAKAHGGQPLDPAEYEANQITVLTDTFSEATQGFNLEGNEALGENFARRKEIEQQDLRVIIGNPPYSVGQDSQNDNNQNESYPELDERVATTYVKQAGKVTLKNSLYDSYIRAFRWASDHIKDRGIVAFVTNAGWVDSAAACGMRRCLQEEFSAVYVFHLKGNQRTSGEQSRREGGKIFGSGSRAPIAITILVKNPEAKEQGKIYFAAVDDYMSREEKLAQLATLRSITRASLTSIVPDDHGDWLNQRRNDFAKFISVNGKDKDTLGIFINYSNGINSGRDSWSFNSSSQALAQNFGRCIACYNEQLTQGAIATRDSTKIKWTRSLENCFKRKLSSPAFNPQDVVAALYRPFCKQKLYNQKFWIEMTCQTSQLFPCAEAENMAIGISGNAASSFSCLISDSICCYDCLEKSKWLPRYFYRPLDDEGKVSSKQANISGVQASLMMEEAEETEDQVVINGYVREDAIKPQGNSIYF